MTKEPDDDWAGFDGSFEGTQRRQVLAGLDLTPTERLRWLEQRMAELRKLKGAAAPDQERDRDITPKP